MASGRSGTAREKALALVAKRLLSEVELRAKLGRAGHTSAEIEDALRLVCGYGYVDDRKLAEAIGVEARRAGRGPLWVEMTLGKRGVGGPIATGVVHAATLEANESARETLSKRFGTRSFDTARERARAYRFLLTRGFTSECAEHIVGREEDR